MRQHGRHHRVPAAALLLLLLVALGWDLQLQLVRVSAAASEGLRARPGAVVAPAAFVGGGPHRSQHSQHQERAARLRLYGRKKRPGGRSGGKGGSGSSNGPAGGGGGGGKSADAQAKAPRPRPIIISAGGAAGGGSGISPGNIASLLSRSDKYGVLRTIEGLPEWELAGPTLVTAWDRLAQRTAAAGPRAPHLPPLHLDRAFHLLVDRTWRRLPDLSPGHCASVASSLAKLRYRPEDAFLSDLLRSCQGQTEGQSFGTAARLAASLARLDYDFGGGGGGGVAKGRGHGSGNGNELAALAGTMRERLAASELEALHAESLAMGLWALAVLGALQVGGGAGAGSDDLRERLLAASIARLKAAHAAAVVGVDARAGGNVLAEGKAKNLVRICRQLRTALLFLPGPPEGGAGAAARVAPSAQEELGRVIEGVWEDLGAWLDPVRRSRLQLEVESTLLAGGGSPAGEWGDGVVSVDIALHPRERPDADSGGGGGGVRPVALEVDGPSHFFLNQPQRPTGDTKIKHQALHVGYPQQWAAVISVPHFEWPRLQKHRLDLLHRKLAQAGLEPAHFLAERKGNGGCGKGGKK